MSPRRLGRLGSWRLRPWRLSLWRLSLWRLSLWRRRYAGLAGGCAVFLCLGIGHWLYAYVPRLRPASPSGIEASLLDAPWAEAAVWVPYPHQNLPMLERRTGLASDSGGDVLTLAGVEALELPAFGGLSVPPARGAAVALGARGELAVVVQVYPAFAAFARLAGALAGNPWLRGGEVSWQGRSAQVEWRGSLWLVGSPNLPVLSELPNRESELPPVLIEAMLEHPETPLPPGRYRLRLEGRDLIVRSSDAELRHAADEAQEPAPLDEIGALVVVLDGGDVSHSQAQAMVLFSQESTAVTELPRAAVLHRGHERWQLPAEGLLDLAGRKPATLPAGNWSLVASDADALDGASRLAAPLDAWLAAGTSRQLDIWLRLGPAAMEMSRVRRGLEKAPFISRRQLGRWLSAERVLHGLSQGHETLQLDVTRETGLLLVIKSRSDPKPRDKS